jgi:predicted extracellular nuclease
MSRTAIAALATGLVAAPLVTTTSTASAVPDGSDVVINEIYVNGGSKDATYRNKYVELYNPTDAAIDLSDWSVQYRAYNSTAAFTGVIPLDGSIQPGGTYLVSGNANSTNGEELPTPDATSTVAFSGSSNGGSLALVSAPDALNGTPETVLADPDLVDLIGYGASNTYEGAPEPGGYSVTESLNRTAGADTDHNAADLSSAGPTPTACGEPCAPVTQEPEEPTPATIEQIQGTGATSPYEGDPIITQGVVTAAYPTGGLDGFNLQTAGSGETLDQASDGIFVYTGGAPTVSIGDHVEVTGEVDEFFGLTQVVAASGGVRTLEEPAAVQPATVAFPRNDAAREALESMLIDPAGPYTLTDNYNAGNRAFGELGLATGNKPLVQPTDVARPGTPEAAAVAADNTARQVLLDDGTTTNFLGSDANKDLPIPYFSGPDDQVRVGAAVTFVQPVVLSYGFSRWRFQPVRPVTDSDEEPVTFEQTRTRQPEDVGGSTTLASFNVLNYFTDLGEDEPGCDSFDDREGNPIVTDFCDVRGAYTEASFQRQQAKIVAAITAMDADVVALMEIENSAAFGHERDQSLAALVGALNATSGSKVWGFAPSPAAVPAEEDVIRTAFIFQKAAVKPVGRSQILQDPAFANARQPLAQTFRERGEATNGTFVAIANHFKSKGSGAGATGDNADTGDGQGAWNGDRIRQAKALVGFADAFSAQAGTDQVFLLGDFNSYTEEDPLQVLEKAGYVNVSQGRTDESSYLFSGLVGSLDHVFASREANPAVTGADIWNINSVEPVMYEYSRFNYNVTNLYEPTPYRASDHDPIVVGLEPERMQAVVKATTRPVPRGRDAAVHVVVESTPVATGTVDVLTVAGRILGSARIRDGAATVVFDTRRRAVATSRLTVRYNGDEDVQPAATTVDQVVLRAVSAVSARVLDERVVAGRTRPWVKVTVDVPDFPRMRPDGRVRITNRSGEVLRRAEVTDGTAFLRLPSFGTAGTRTLAVDYTGTWEVARSSDAFQVRVVRR